MESIYYVLCWHCHRRCKHCYESRFRPYLRDELETVVAEAARNAPVIVGHLPESMLYLEPHGKASPGVPDYEEKVGKVILSGGDTGYKTPKITDLYDGVTGFGGQGTSPFVGNPDLQPETSVNREIAFYWTSTRNRHNFNITYFVNDFEDKISRGEASLSCEQTNGIRPCANLGAYGQLNYTSYSQRVNIDEAEIQGVELAGRYQIFERLALRANYTWTDSEQITGVDAGLPLTNTAENMINATLDWYVSDALSMQLTAESRSDRYRGTDANGNRLDYNAYDVLHLGAQYHLNDHITLSARINNLLNEDFTSFQTRFM